MRLICRTARSLVARSMAKMVVVAVGLACGAGPCGLRAHDLLVTGPGAPEWFVGGTSRSRTAARPTTALGQNGASMVASFGSFKPRVRFFWDSTTFYVESDGMPLNTFMPSLMTGITSWQQQVPVPTSYFASTTNPESNTASLGYGQPNVWRLPLVPTPSASPIAIDTTNFLRGAIAIGADGVAIFNPHNNTGRLSYEIGELDQYGGHCGLADDYHYHIAPVHLQKVLGVASPIAWMLDGYPMYGYTEPDGTARFPLDTSGGHSHGPWGYHYHAVGSAQTGPQRPYLPTAFHGTVVNFGGQVDGQPEVSPIRASGTGGYTATPVAGASISGYKNPTALAANSQGNLTPSSSGAPSQDQYLMTVAVGTGSYPIAWQFNRSANPKTMTVTWQLPTVQATTQTYNSTQSRIAAYPMAAWSLLKLPDTGQTIHATGTFGEDSDYTINPPSYTDNGNGTITDKVTGLMWQKVDSGEMTWATAVAQASKVTTGGYTDWRLPTPTELFSIMNHNRNGLAMDPTYFPANPAGAADYWWTSDIYGSTATLAWCVNAGGGMGPKPLTETLSAGGSFRYDARYVRGPSPSNGHNYVNNLDGTITDSDTGLMWTQVPGPATDWNSALTYAQSLRLGGYADWRLPSIKELQTLTDYTLASATTAANARAPINRFLFPAATTAATAYWSSTVLAGNGTNYTQAWLQEFGVNNSVPAANGPTRNYQGIISYEVMTSHYPVFAVRTASLLAAPAITSQPVSQTIAPSSTVVFRVAATGAAPLSYVWTLNGAPLAGATSASLLIPAAGVSSAGSYLCIVSNSGGSTPSLPAVLTVAATKAPGRLVNISTLSSIPARGALTAGFVVGGTGTGGALPVLVRASGPALTDFSVANALPDPNLSLASTSGPTSVVGTNSGWGGSAAISQAAVATGAFAWQNSSSKDAALAMTGISSLTSGNYSATVTGASGDGGSTLLEVYDATPSGAYASTSSRLVNISSLAQAGSGGSILTAGFVLGGSTSKTVLVRAAGPALAPFGVQSLLADPQISLISGSAVVASNVGWNGDPQIASVAASVGAFSWGTAATPDSALVATLAPGAYTIQVTGVSGDSGTALVEVYEVP